MIGSDTWEGAYYVFVQVSDPIGSHFIANLAIVFNPETAPYVGSP
jgi:hypothetical protein